MAMSEYNFELFDVTAEYEDLVEADDDVMDEDEFLIELTSDSEEDFIEIEDLIAEDEDFLEMDNAATEEDEDLIDLSDGAAPDPVYTVNYRWLATSTFEVAAFLVSVVQACRPHGVLRASAAMQRVQRQVRFFEALRFRYLNTLQRPRWVLAANETAFDVVMARLFFACTIESRALRLMSHAARWRGSIVRCLEDPDVALHALRQVACAFGQLEQQISDFCVLHSISLSQFRQTCSRAWL